MDKPPIPEADKDPAGDNPDRLAFLDACAEEGRSSRYLAGALQELRAQTTVLRDRWHHLCQSLETPQYQPPLPGFQRVERVEDFSALPETASSELVSLDIFDTCLVRDLSPAVEIFQLLGGHVEEMGLMEAGEFARERQQVEQDLRREGLESNGPEDVSFAAIHREIARRHGWEAFIKKRVMDREIWLERFFLRADPTVRAFAQNHVRNGGQLVYLSEMYLDGETLRGLLEENGFPVEGAAIFSSGECGLSKGTGNLFRHAASMFPGREILHIGDHETSDGEMARESGLSTVIIKTSRSLYPDLLSNVLSATRCGTGDVDSGNFWQAFGRTIAGPLHFAFAVNLYREARNRQVENVYFLSRDGWFPQKVYDRLQAAWGKAAEPHYLYASREYFGIGSMREIGSQEWDFLLKPAPLLRGGDCLLRLGIPKTLHESTLAGAGLPEPSKRLCHHWGFKDPDSRDRLYRAICSRIDSFLAYRDVVRASLSLHLEQSGIFGQPSLFVDLGWGGSSARALRSMVPGGGTVPHGHYFALFASTPGCSCYFDPEEAPSRAGILRGSVALLEFLFGSPEPTVRGMEEQARGLKPRFRKEWPAYDLLAWREMERGILSYAESVLEILRQLPGEGNGLALVEDILRKLIFDPSLEELDHLGALCHGEGWGTDNRLRMLPRTELLREPGPLHEAYCYCPWKPGLQKLLMENSH